MNARTDLGPVMQAVATAKGLPNAHYIDPAIFDEEKHAVLFSSWAGVGFGKDVPNPGDAKPIAFLGVPLLLIRDQDGTIGVFQNTCRHRGMILVAEPTNVRGTIRCPYHSWCYGLNGALRATPHVGGPGQNIHTDIKRDELGLLRLRSYVWHDTIFVNVDGQADDFAVVHADLMARWGAFDQPIHHGGPDSSFQLAVQTNWKLAVENYCESYHLPWVHPSLNTYSRLEDHYNIEVPGAYSGQGTLVYRQLKSEDGRAFPDYASLTEKWDEGAEYVAVYPNVLMGVHRDHFFSIVLEPIDHENTVEHIELYYTQDPSPDDGLDDLRQQNAALWKTVFSEDIFVVEGMQKGRKGPLFDGGKFSPAMDGPTHMFHHWVASKIDKARQ